MPHPQHDAVPTGAVQVHQPSLTIAGEGCPRKRACLTYREGGPAGEPAASFGWRANHCVTFASAKRSEKLAPARRVSNAPKRFVCLLRSLHDLGRHCVGLTSDVTPRLATHNAGHCPHTARHNRGSRLYPVNSPRSRLRCGSSAISNLAQGGRWPSGTCREVCGAHAARTGK